jgi:hypothetical protein
MFLNACIVASYGIGRIQIWTGDPVFRSREMYGNEVVALRLMECALSSTARTVLARTYSSFILIELYSF